MSKLSPILSAEIANQLKMYEEYAQVGSPNGEPKQKNETDKALDDDLEQKNLKMSSERKKNPTFSNPLLADSDDKSNDGQKKMETDEVPATQKSTVAKKQKDEILLAKIRFFEALVSLDNRGLLTVSTLTDCVLLEKNVFSPHLVESFGSFLDCWRPSTLVNLIFEELGVAIDLAYMDKPVKVGEAGRYPALRENIEHKLLESVKDFEYNNHLRRKLDREVLTLCLSSQLPKKNALYYAENFPYCEKANSYADFYKIIFKSQYNKDRLENDLLTIANRFPNYIPYVLEDLFQAFKDEKDTEERARFFNFITAIVNNLNNKVLETGDMHLLNSIVAHPGLATEIVKIDYQLFFRIDPAIHNTVYQNLSREVLVAEKIEAKESKAKEVKNLSDEKKSEGISEMDEVKKTVDRRVHSLRTTVANIGKSIEIKRNNHKKKLEISSKTKKNLDKTIAQERLKPVAAVIKRYLNNANITTVKRIFFTELLQKLNLNPNFSAKDLKEYEEYQFDAKAGEKPRLSRYDFEKGFFTHRARDCLKTVTELLQSPTEKALAAVATYEQSLGNDEKKIETNNIIYWIKSQLQKKELTYVDQPSAHASKVLPQRKGLTYVDLEFKVKTGTANTDLNASFSDSFNKASATDIDYAKRYLDGANSSAAKCFFKVKEILLRAECDSTLSSRAIAIQQTVQFNKKLEVEALYQQMLLNKALACKPSDFIFSPTGLAIITIEFTPDDEKDLFNKAREKGLIEDLNIKSFQSGELYPIHSKFTDCRLDVTGHTALTAAWKEKAENVKVEEKKATNLSAFTDKLKQHRNELNPLHDEILKYSQRVMHVLRTEDNFKSILDEKWELVKKQYFRSVDNLVWNEFARIFADNPLLAHDPNYGKKLNSKLNSARETLKNRSLHQLITVLSNNGYTDHIKVLADGNFNAVGFNAKLTEYTSTSHDEFLTDPGNEIASRITGTENTAHHKSLGRDKLAKRYIWTTELTALDSDSALTYIAPIPGRGPEVRTPSIQAKEKDENYVFLEVIDKKVKNLETVVKNENLFNAVIAIRSSDDSDYYNDNKKYELYFVKNGILLRDDDDTPLRVSYDSKDEVELSDSYEPESESKERPKSTPDLIAHLLEGKEDQHNKYCKLLISNERILHRVNKKSRIIADNVLKFEELFADYPGSQPRTYRLLTSFNRIFKTGEGNDASLIVRSSHVYNKRQLLTNKPFVYVQSIPVNNSGRELSLDRWQSPKGTHEAALIAEISLLNTLRQNLAYLPFALRAPIQSLYAEAEKQYHSFLLSYQKSGDYFSESAEGKAFISHLESFRKHEVICQQSPAKTLYGLVTTPELETVAARHQETPCMQQLVAQALTIMHLHNQHFNLNFGRLSQCMTSFLDTGGLGCKSGNERYGMISGREKVFLTMWLKEKNGDQLSHEESAVKQALINFSICTNANSHCIESLLDNLRSSVATAYSKHHFAGISNISSSTDQGPSKVEKPRFQFFQGLNTNWAEDVEVALDASKASKLQPHKSDTFGMLQQCAKLSLETKAKVLNRDEKSTDASGNQSGPKVFSNSR